MAHGDTRRNEFSDINLCVSTISWSEWVKRDTMQVREYVESANSRADGHPHVYFALRPLYPCILQS